MKKPNTNETNSKVLSSDEIEASTNLAQYLSSNEHLLLPMVDLVEQSKMAIEELINETGRLVIETLLRASASQIAGPKQQGKRDGAKAIQWYGTQGGRVSLAERKIRIRKPRLRQKGKAGREV